MTALVHLALILGAPVLAVFLIRRHAHRPTAGRVAAALAGLLVPLLSLGAGLHRCDCGVPLFQWVLPSAALFGVLLLVEPMKPRVFAAIALSVTSLTLSFHYAGAVHGPTWVGNPESFTLESTRARFEWHTALTGLYRRVPVEAD
jgi:hypothetical protein